MESVVVQKSEQTNIDCTKFYQFSSLLIRPFFFSKTVMRYSPYHRSMHSKTKIAFLLIGIFHFINSQNAPLTSLFSFLFVSIMKGS